MHAQGAALAGLSAEIQYVDSNHSISIPLQEGQEEDAWYDLFFQFIKTCIDSLPPVFLILTQDDGDSLIQS